MDKELEERIKKIESWMYKINKLLYGNIQKSNHINTGCCPGVVQEIGLITDIKGIYSIIKLLHPEVYGKKK